jgi:hypothetical protein
VDVAHYIAQNASSNANALALFARLKAYSSLAGTQITLAYTQRVLKNFIGPEASNVRAEPAVRIGASFSACLQIMDGRKSSRGRHQLEVNMREGERARLARRDAYERDLELHSKKRIRG